MRLPSFTTDRARDSSNTFTPASRTSSLKARSATFGSKASDGGRMKSTPPVDRPSIFVAAISNTFSGS